MKTASKTVRKSKRSITPKATATKSAKAVAQQRVMVQELLDGNGRRECLELSTPDNRLFVLVENGGRNTPPVREVTLAESFTWYQQAHDPQWWVDGNAGDALADWLGMVEKGLSTASTLEAKPDSGEWLIARQHNKEMLYIRDGALELECGGKRRAVSVSEALRWWLVSVEGCANQEDVSGDCAGEWEFFQLLTQGILVPMNDGELAAAKLCAQTKNNGDLAAWAKAWVSSGIEADIDSYKGDLRKSA
jgi:hypothetical protein